MPLLVYQTDEDGIYLGTTEADDDPLDGGNYLVPANCVLLPPPNFGTNLWPRWNGSHWIPVPDYRGTIAYDLSTGDAVTIVTIGKTLEELGLSRIPVADPRLAFAAGSARSVRLESKRKDKAKKLSAKGKDLEALKLLNGL